MTRGKADALFSAFVQEAHTVAHQSEGSPVMSSGRTVTRPSRSSLDLEQVSYETYKPTHPEEEKRELQRRFSVFEAAVNELRARFARVKDTFTEKSRRNDDITDGDLRRLGEIGCLVVALFSEIEVERVRHVPSNARKMFHFSSACLMDVSAKKNFNSWYRAMRNSLATLIAEYEKLNETCTFEICEFNDGEPPENAIRIPGLYVFSKNKRFIQFRQGQLAVYKISSLLLRSSAHQDGEILNASSRTALAGPNTLYTIRPMKTTSNIHGLKTKKKGKGVASFEKLKNLKRNFGRPEFWGPDAGPHQLKNDSDGSESAPKNRKVSPNQNSFGAGGSGAGAAPVGFKSGGEAPQNSSGNNARLSSAPGQFKPQATHSASKLPPQNRDDLGHQTEAYLYFDGTVETCKTEYRRVKQRLSQLETCFSRDKLMPGPLTIKAYAELVKLGGTTERLMDRFVEERAAQGRDHKDRRWSFSPSVRAELGETSTKYLSSKFNSLALNLNSLVTHFKKIFFEYFDTIQAYNSSEHAKLHGEVTIPRKLRQTGTKKGFYNAAGGWVRQRGGKRGGHRGGHGGHVSGSVGHGSGRNLEQSGYHMGNYGPNDQRGYGVGNYGPDDQPGYGVEDYGTEEQSGNDMEDYGPGEQFGYGVENYGPEEQAGYDMENYGAEEQYNYGVDNFGSEEPRQQWSAPSGSYPGSMEQGLGDEDSYYQEGQQFTSSITQPGNSHSTTTFLRSGQSAGPAPQTVDTCGQGVAKFNSQLPPPPLPPMSLFKQGPPPHGSQFETKPPPYGPGTHCDIMQGYSPDVYSTKSHAAQSQNLSGQGASDGAVRSTEYYSGDCFQGQMNQTSTNLGQTGSSDYMGYQSGNSATAAGLELGYWSEPSGYQSSQQQDPSTHYYSTSTSYESHSGPDPASSRNSLPANSSSPFKTPFQAPPPWPAVNSATSSYAQPPVRQAETVDGGGLLPTPPGPDSYRQPSYPGGLSAPFPQGPRPAESYSHGRAFPHPSPSGSRGPNPAAVRPGSQFPRPRYPPAATSQWGPRTPAPGPSRPAVSPSADPTAGKYLGCHCSVPCSGNILENMPTQAGPELDLPPEALHWHKLSLMYRDVSKVHTQLKQAGKLFDKLNRNYHKRAAKKVVDVCATLPLLASVMKELRAAHEDCGHTEEPPFSQEEVEKFDLKNLANIGISDVETALANEYVELHEYYKWRKNVIQRFHPHAELLRGIRARVYPYKEKATKEDTGAPVKGRGGNLKSCGVFSNKVEDQEKVKYYQMLLRVQKKVASLRNQLRDKKNMVKKKGGLHVERQPDTLVVLRKIITSLDQLKKEMVRNEVYREMYGKFVPRYIQSLLKGKGGGKKKTLDNHIKNYGHILKMIGWTVKELREFVEQLSPVFRKQLDLDILDEGEEEVEGGEGYSEPRTQRTRSV